MMTEYRPSLVKSKFRILVHLMILKISTSTKYLCLYKPWNWSGTNNKLHFKFHEIQTYFTKTFLKFLKMYGKNTVFIKNYTIYN